MKLRVLVGLITLPFLATAPPSLADDGSGSCSNAHLKGRYGLATHGVVIGVYDNATPRVLHYYEPDKTPLKVDLVSDETYDGRGNSTFSYLGFLNGRKFSTSDPGEDFNTEGATGTYDVNKDCTGFVDVKFPGNSDNTFKFHRAFVLSNDGKTVHMLWTEVHFSNIVLPRLLPLSVTCKAADGGCDLAVQVYSDGERY
jgi:hypothetical protein